MDNYNDIKQIWDSDEEVYFHWYLSELLHQGYISSFQRAPSYSLGENVNRTVKKQLKTKTKEITQNLLKPSIYTPDVTIVWTLKALGVFVVKIDSDVPKGRDIPFYCDNDLISIVEIKADFDQQNMTRLVRTNIKWVYDKYGVFVNLTKVPKIFRDTFTPQRYLLTDRTLKPRAIKWKPKSLEEFVNLSK